MKLSSGQRPAPSAQSHASSRPTKRPHPLCDKRSLLRNALSRALAAAALCLAAFGAEAQARLIDAVDVNQTETHIDLIVQFACGMRYLGHDPSSQGERVRIRMIPTPQCGLRPGAMFSSELAAAGDPDIVRSIALEQVFAQELALTVEWRRPERFVLAPSADFTGVRIRLLRGGETKTRVFINEGAGGDAHYAINLDSSAQPHDAAALEQARGLLGVAAYESTVELSGATWHRLRVGPFATREDADRALALARTHYPRAWLAIGDDEAHKSAQPVETAPGPTRTNVAAARLSQAEIAALISQARDSMRRKDYAAAIGALTRVVEQPEFTQRAEALELLGLARERNRQLAHAKAEYQEYLRLYPQSQDAPRVRQRLRALAAALRRGADRRVTFDDEATSPWRVYGGAGLRYQRDTNQIDAPDQSLDFVAQNALISDVDAVARRKGLRFDFLGRASAGYQKDLLKDGPGDRTRVSAAYAELADRDLGWSARLGRQSRSVGGLLGPFDGLLAGYQIAPQVRVNALFGSPVESSYASFDADRSLYGVSVDLGPFAGRWDASAYAVEQRIDGVEERRAVGAELRYFQPGRSLVGLVDYDVSFSELNSAVLVGVIDLPARWTVNFNLDHRTSPLLTTRNALIGQPVDSLDELGGLFTETQLRELAEDRTAQTDAYSLAASHPLSERVQLVADVTSMSAAATTASGGVAAIEAMDATAYSVQLIGGGWLAARDFNVLGVRWQDSDQANLASLAWYTRFPIGERWRLGPRMRVDRQELARDESTLLRYAPSLRLDFLGRRMFFLLEAGAELGARDTADATEDSTRYYVGAEYRWNF